MLLVSPSAVYLGLLGCGLTASAAVGNQKTSAWISEVKMLQNNMC